MNWNWLYLKGGIVTYLLWKMSEIYISKAIVGISTLRKFVNLWSNKYFRVTFCQVKMEDTMGKESTRIKLIRAFAQLLVENGYQAATTSKTAKLAGANEGSIFRIFKNKRGLLQALIDQCMQDINSLQYKDIEKMTIEECLQKTAQQYQAFMIKHQALVVVGVKESLELREVGEAIEAVSTHFKKAIEKILLEKAESGCLSKKINPKIQANNFVWLNFGYFITNKRFKYTETKTVENQEDKVLKEHVLEYLKGII